MGSRTLVTVGCARVDAAGLRSLLVICCDRLRLSDWSSVDIPRYFVRTLHSIAAHPETDMSHDSPWLAELTHLDKNARLRAVMALGQAAESESLPALLQQLRVEPDFFVRDNLSWAIARCGEGAVVPLIALLADGAADVRYHAAHALSKLGDVRAVDALITLLDDVDADVVQKAVFALGRLRDTRALPALASQIGGGTRELVIARKEAFEAFGELAVPQLAASLSHAESAVRVEVTELLGCIGGHAVTLSLATAASDTDWQVRFAAINALRGVTHPAAHAVLTMAATDVHAHVRLLATRLLQEQA